MTNEEKLKEQIIEVLSHPEADEGLYFRNFTNLHEEDDRPKIEADEADILLILNELVREGVVVLEENQGEAVFILKGVHPSATGSAQ